MSSQVEVGIGPKIHCSADSAPAQFQVGGSGHQCPSHSMLNFISSSAPAQIGSCWQLPLRCQVDWSSRVAVQVTGFARGAPRVQLDIRLHCMSKLVAVGMGAWPIAGLIQLLRSSMLVAVGIGANIHCSADSSSAQFEAGRQWAPVQSIAYREGVEAVVKWPLRCQMDWRRGSFLT